MWNGLDPHPHVVDKNSGGTSWEQGVPAPHQDPSPGFQLQEDKSHSFWLQKPAGIESVGETSGAPSSFS